MMKSSVKGFLPSTDDQGNNGLIFTPSADGWDRAEDDKYGYQMARTESGRWLVIVTAIAGEEEITYARERRVFANWPKAAEWANAYSHYHARKEGR